MALRIIGGVAKGRKIKTPAGRRTRPTSDRVREAVFDMLAGRPGGSIVLDLFAGSGAMGIEALSRGASNATFVESNNATIKIIKSNIETCGFSDSATFVNRRLPGVLGSLLEKEGPFDLIFIDPPYDDDMAQKTLVVLAEKNGIAPGGWVILEHSARDDMPEDVAALKKVRLKKYGSTSISIYEMET